MLMTRIVSIALLLLSLNTYAANSGMVVSEQKVASTVGADILRAGGNAVDAAVAVGYALAVVNPCCGNIGGGGFMTIHLANGQNIFINFREKAPFKATRDMFLNNPDATTSGYLAVGVPGTVLGLDTALQKYGTMTRKQVMAPAIKLAKEGYQVTWFDAKWFKSYAKDFRQQPNVAAIFLNHGEPYKQGERLVQTDLAYTLQQISDLGPDVFYKGWIADEIVNASKSHGGILTLQDFTNYTVEQLTPIHCNYRGYDIISAPPPSSGGVTLCETLNILENFPLRQLGYRSAQGVQDILEAMRDGYRDRNERLGDPDFITNPIDKLLSKEYAAKLSKKIQQLRSAPIVSPTNNHHELTDTTHYSVVDIMGNAVAVTYTINGFFGAKVIAGKTGFFLNDEMDDFATKPGSANKFGLVQYENNDIKPGKRPLSSMTPTIVMKDGKVFMVLGSPGGPRIITSVLLTILNVIDYGMPIQQAVNAPRFHFQGDPDSVDMEPLALPYLTSKRLQLKGYHLTPQSTWSAVEAILIDPKDGNRYGANDCRRPDGAAIKE